MSGNHTHPFSALHQVPSPVLHIPHVLVFFCSCIQRYTHFPSDISDAHVNAVLKSPPRETNEGLLNAAHAAVLSYTDAMTLDVQVSDEVFAKLKEWFSEREIVEITTTVAAYNCVSRVLVALDVGERNAQTGPKEGGKE